MKDLPKAPRGLAALILKDASSKNEHGADEGESSGEYDLGLTTTADEIMQAHKSGDADGLRDALCAFIDQHLARKD